MKIFYQISNSPKFYFDQIPKNIQKNNKAWILIKFQCVIYQLIFLNELYKLMKSLFQLEISFRNSGRKTKNIQTNEEDLFVWTNKEDLFVWLNYISMDLPSWCVSNEGSIKKWRRGKHFEGRSFFFNVSSSKRHHQESKNRIHWLNVYTTIQNKKQKLDANPRRE